MKLVDAHQHYWMLKRGDYAWLTPREGSLFRDFEPRDLLPALTDCGVIATVLVQAAATEAETRFLIDLARAHTSIAGIVGWVDFESPDVDRRIRRLIAEGGGKLKGFRPMIQDIRDTAWLDKTTLDSAFDAIVECDLTFDALVNLSHLEALARRLRKHPRLRAVLDHGGKPDIAHDGLGSWAGQLTRLAGVGSLHCKLSGLLTQARSGAAAADLDDYVAHIFTCFGPERVMWGSDWPVITLSTTYQSWLTMALALVKRHAPGHLQAVFADNARRFYGLNYKGE